MFSIHFSTAFLLDYNFKCFFFPKWLFGAMKFDLLETSDTFKIYINVIGRTLVIYQQLLSWNTYSQFHQQYRRAFFEQIFQQSQNVTRKMTFVGKNRMYNVDEIDT